MGICELGRELNNTDRGCIPAPSAPGCRQNRKAFLPPWILAFLCVCFAVWHPSTLASDASSPVSINVKSLMRSVAYNELHARRHPAHLYQSVVNQQTPEGSRMSLQIVTYQGAVSRLLKVNGKAPTRKQCDSNLVLLSRIAASPRLQQSRLKSQQSEMRRREQLFESMPTAFLFKYDGTEKSTGFLRISYRPNPQFRPPNRAAGVLAGLEGILWVDPSSQRLARIQGRLNKDVSFGWGILARLYRGGQFVLEQNKLKDGTWQVHSLFVRFQGTILLLKKLNVDMKQTFSSYKEVPEGITLDQAVERLKGVPCRE